MTARGAGGSNADVELCQKRAFCQALVEYLWRCSGRGGLKIGPGFLIVPSALPQPEPVSSGAGGGVAGPSAPPLAPAPEGAPGGPGNPMEVRSVGGGGSAAAQGSRKRTLREPHDAIDELSDWSSLAEGLGQPGGRDSAATPLARHPMTYVSIPNKVRACVLSLMCASDPICSGFFLAPPS